MTTLKRYLCPRPDPMFFILVVKCSKSNLFKSTGRRVISPQNLFCIKLTQSLKDPPQTLQLFFCQSPSSQISSFEFKQWSNAFKYLEPSYQDASSFYLLCICRDIFSSFESLTKSAICSYGYTTWSCF